MLQTSFGPSRAPQQPPSSKFTPLLDPCMNKGNIIEYSVVTPRPNGVDPDRQTGLIQHPHRALHDISGQRRPYQAHIPFHPVKIIAHSQDVAGPSTNVSNKFASKYKNEVCNLGDTTRPCSTSCSTTHPSQVSFASTAARWASVWVWMATSDSITSGALLRATNVSKASTSLLLTKTPSTTGPL